jgi:hypothetical protein
MPGISGPRDFCAASFTSVFLGTPSLSGCWHCWGRVDPAPVKDPSPMNLRDLAKFSIRCGTWRYYALPCLYHSAVSKAVLDKIRSRTGRVFHSTNPDVFMAFALPAVCASAVNVGLSLTVNGTSGKSNGGSYATPDGANVLERFLREYGDYRVHSSLCQGCL